MYCRQSEIDFMEALRIASHNFGAIKVYYNNKLIWDDGLSWNEGWIPLKEAIEQFKQKYPMWEHIRVNSIKINVVDWHHSIVRLKGKVVKEK